MNAPFKFQTKNKHHCGHFKCHYPTLLAVQKCQSLSSSAATKTNKSYVISASHLQHLLIQKRDLRHNQNLSGGLAPAEASHKVLLAFSFSQLAQDHEPSNKQLFFYHRGDETGLSLVDQTASLP